MLAITERLLPISKRRSGQLIKGVAFLVAHDTGNDGSTAKQNVDYYIKSANEIEASAHYFVDDVQIIRCVPEGEKAWHVRYDVPTDNAMFGKDANDWAIGIELCYSTKGLINNEKSYQNYVDLIASLCVKYKLSAEKFITGHDKLDPTRRTDPMNAFKIMGKTWAGFVSDVSSRMGATVAPAPSQPSTAPSLDVIRAKAKEVFKSVAELNELLK